MISKSQNKFLKNKMSKKILHIGNHETHSKNAGDTLLFPVTRECFEIFNSNINWSLAHVWKDFDVKTAKRVNNEFDEILIGGGGMFLRDQDGSDTSKSGWQWNCDMEALNEIKIPINIFGVGYNRFRGQQDFEKIFSDHLELVVRKSNFVGLRNTGSIKAVQRYLPFDLKDKISLQFCPTTCLWQLKKKYMKKSFEHRNSKTKILAFNPAWDRVDMRFPNGIDSDIQPVLNSLLVAVKRGWEIYIVAHKHIDLNIVPYLEKIQLPFKIKNLSDSSPDQICDFYSEIDCSFGMRGHSQLIPLGLRKPIVSIITHDKMRFLLDDINQGSWGLEIDDPLFQERWESLLDEFCERRLSTYETLDSVQSDIWKKTKSNFEILK